MARKSNAAKLAEIHAEALREFDDIQTAQRQVRLACLQDRRFYSVEGAQWEGDLGDQFENKPRFEFNKVHLSVIRVVNEYRNNRITVDFVPKDGTEDDKLADTCDGLLRADEKACSANEAYDNAFEEGVSGGFGAWRVRACYEDEDDEDDTRQRVRFEPIFDADSTVFFDLNSRRQDKADAKRCYVLIPYSREAYKAEFNDEPSTWDRTITQAEFDWCTEETVYVCELYKVEEASEVVRFYRGLDDAEMQVTERELEEDDQLEDDLAATGFRLMREKRVKRREVHKYLLSGGKVLEDCGVIPGKCIPIIPYFGKRWVVDGVERCMGHVRLAKDAQRLTNMLMSWLAEMAARFDVEKPIFTPAQLGQHATMWAEDNIKKYPYLLLDPLIDPTSGQMIVQPMGYTKAPQIPPAMAALTQLAEQGLQDLLGKAQAGEEMRSNISGKAVELIQQRLDMQVFIYMSNLAKAHKRSGEVWLSMMKDIAIEDGRKMKVLDQNGKPASVELNRPMYDAETGETYRENSLSEASFEVDVDVGPSSTSARSATVRALTGLASITQDPETLQALTIASIMNIEGEGLTGLRDWARRRAVRLGIEQPNDAEKAEMAKEQEGQQPDAQQAYLLAEAQKSMAETQLTQERLAEVAANTALKNAQRVKTLTDAGVAAKAAQQPEQAPKAKPGESV